MAVVSAIYRYQMPLYVPCSVSVYRSLTLTLLAGSCGQGERGGVERAE